MPVWGSVLVVIALVLVEALFVAAEIALVSLRESQVRALADKGGRGQRVSELVSNPNRFLGAVQIGVTTTAILVSAFGEATLGHPVGHGLEHLGLSRRVADIIGFVVVVVAISYVTIVLGELVPKRLALQRAEGTALAFGAPLDRFARMMRPVIWFLSKSTDVLVRLSGGDPSVNRETITEEELRDLVTAHEALSRDERALIDEVFEAGERQLREVMVPRTEVEFLDAGWSVTRAVKFAQPLPHSRFPVVRGSHDDIVGFVHVRDLFEREVVGRSVRVADLAREVLQLPATRQILSALTDMRRAGAHLAIVVDEYGGTAGIITLEDLVEELIGDIRDEYDVDEPETTRSLTGELEVDGLLNLDDFEDETGIELPEGPYETVAGFIVQQLGHVPGIGEGTLFDRYELSVRDLDGRRIARVRVRPLAEPPPPTTGG
jgi:putative hemolysin